MLARRVLWYVTFVGFGVNYMHRIHINIILVGMVKQISGSGNSSTTISECVNQYQQIGPHNETSVATINQVIHSEGFDWDAQEQNLILGSFFWFHWLTQLPGGVLAHHFGTKKVFGLANLIACLLTFLLPTAAKIDLRLLLLMRSLQGFIMGVAWPSMHHLTAHWIPPNERSKFVSSYLGASVGVAVTYPLCGFVMDMLGWEAAFYTTGVIGLIWYTFWVCLVYDTPALHPRISTKEKEYIENNIGQSVTKRKMPIPWKKVFTSAPVLMVCIVQLGNSWGFYTLVIHMPTYFRTILGLDMKRTGMYTGLPHLMRWIFSFAFAVFADYLLKAKLLSRTNVRKLATSICTVFQGFMILGLAFSGCNSTVATIFLIAAVGVNGAFSSGPLACVVDLSPNFASVLLGIVGAAANITGFMTPILVGYLTYGNQTAEQWEKIFLIITGILVFTGMLYVIFGEANVQPWNDGSEPLNDSEKIAKEDILCEKEMKNMALIIPSNGTEIVLQK